MVLPEIDGTEWVRKVMPCHGTAMKVGKLSALWDSTSSRCFVGKVPSMPTCLVCGDARKCAIDFYPRKVGFRERMRCGRGRKGDEGRGKSGGISRWVSRCASLTREWRG